MKHQRQSQKKFLNREAHHRPVRQGRRKLLSCPQAPLKDGLKYVLQVWCDVGLSAAAGSLIGLVIAAVVFLGVVFSFWIAALISAPANRRSENIRVLPVVADCHSNSQKANGSISENSNVNAAQKAPYLPKNPG
jgi:hypothetical protein